MRTWTRAIDVTLCGGPCGHRIQTGDPMLEIRLDILSKSRRLLRCVRCAGEPVPVDLPPLFSKTIQPTPTALVHIATGANALPLDWKSAGAGREPGQEG